MQQHISEISVQLRLSLLTGLGSIVLPRTEGQQSHLHPNRYVVQGGIQIWDNTDWLASTSDIRQ
jgi:hypothetical protein